MMRVCRALMLGWLAAAVLAAVLGLGESHADYIDLNFLNSLSSTLEADRSDNTYDITVNWSGSVTSSHWQFERWELKTVASDCGGTSLNANTVFRGATSLTLFGIPDDVGSCRVRLSQRIYRPEGGGSYFVPFGDVLVTIAPLGPTPTPDPNAPPPPTATPAHRGSLGAVGYTFEPDVQQCGTKIFVQLNIRGGTRKLITLQRTYVEARPDNAPIRHGVYTGSTTATYFTPTQSSSLRAVDTVLLIIDTAHATYPGSATINIWGSDSSASPTYITALTSVSAIASNNLYPPHYISEPPTILSAEREDDLLNIQLEPQLLIIRTREGDYPPDPLMTPTPTPLPSYDWKDLHRPKRNTAWEVLIDNDKNGIVESVATGDRAIADRFAISIPDDSEYMSYAARSGLCLAPEIATYPFSSVGGPMDWIRVAFPEGRHGASGPQPAYELVIDDRLAYPDFKPYTYYSSPWTGTVQVATDPAERILDAPDNALFAVREPDERLVGFVGGLMTIGRLSPGDGADETPVEPFVMLLCLLIAFVLALVALAIGGGERIIHPARVFLATLMFSLVWSVCGPLDYGVPVTLAVPPLLIPIALAVILSQNK